MSATPTNTTAREPSLARGAPCVRVSLVDVSPGRSCELTKPVTLLGGRGDCDLVVRTPEVSRTHCALVHTGGAVLVADLCSRSGTFLNDERVSVAAVLPGDRLRLGPIEVSIEWIDAPPDAASIDRQAALHPPAALRIAGAETPGEIEELPAVIGRRKTCAVVVDTPDVSLAHALLYSLNSYVAVYDLGSRSGTYLNGKRVNSAWVRDGDELSIGGETLTIDWEGASMKEAAPEPAAAANASNDSMLAAFTALSGTDVHGLMATVQANLAGLQAEIARRTGDLQSQTEELEERQAELDEENASIERRRRELDRQSDSIYEREQAFAESQEGLASREAACAQKEIECARQVTECEKRVSELEQRERDISKRQTAVASQEKEISQRQEAVASREQDISQRQDAVESREKELAATAEQQQTVQAEMQARRERFRAAVGRLRRHQEKLLKRKRDIEERVAEYHQTLDELAEQQAKIDRSAKGLEQRLAEITQREQALADRERETAKTVREIEAFKSALGEASAALTAARGNAATPADEKANEPRADPPPSQVSTALTTEGVLPAPVVDQPMFAAGTTAYNDWPSEWRDRYQVLRRVSNASDEELRAQVRAEFEAREALEPATNGLGGKKKRSGWWS